MPSYYEIRVAGVLPPEALLDFDRLTASVETLVHGQAAAPAAIAALAWVHFSLASSLGDTSMSLIHWRVADSRCPPPMARPVSAINVPAPTITELPAPSRGRGAVITRQE